MKRSIILLSMLFIVVLAAFPASAQDTAATPAPCTAADLKQTLDLMSGLSDKISTPMTLSAQPTADGLTTSLLALSETYQSFSEIYYTLPTCADGALLADGVAVMLNQQLTVTAITLFNTVHSSDKTLDTDITPALSNLWTIESDQAMSMTSGITSMLGQLKTGTGMPSWLPTCSADQLKFTTQLDDLETTYSNQIPALQAYLETGKVDKDAYIAIITLDTTIANALKHGSVACSEIYGRALSDVYTFENTFLALTLGQIAPYLANTPSADQFKQSVDFFNESLTSYVSSMTATETPQ